jgi:hypothetical protein
MIWKAAFGRLQVANRYGWEYFRDGRFNLPVQLVNLWEWQTTALNSNAARAGLGEFLVAYALDIVKPHEMEPGADYDLLTRSGLKIKVETAAFVGSWPRERLNAILFNIAPKWVWNEKTQRPDDTLRRPADIYVFALLNHKNGGPVDVADVANWTYFVVASRALDAYERAQPYITLKALQARGGNRAGPLWRGPIPYLKLHVEIEGLGDTLRAMS